jgi:hypothetical protein
VNRSGFFSSSSSSSKKEKKKASAVNERASPPLLRTTVGSIVVVNRSDAVTEQPQSHGRGVTNATTSARNQTNATHHEQR